MNTRNICVIGLGYVGLPLAISLAKQNYGVVGYDINETRVSELQNGFDLTYEVSRDALNQSSLKITDKIELVIDCDFFIVTVPTPTGEGNIPDLTAIIKATEMIGGFLKNGDIVVYESTVYPGVTEETCAPVLEKVSGLKYLQDFNIGYSPERINPGDKVKTLENVVKIVSGDTIDSLEIISSVYESIITAGVHRASSIKVAEAAKVIENTQRDVNIALMNELSELFNRLNIDTHEVLQAAGTKYNFLNFYPGLVGGHCIGVDPYYLSYKAEIHGFLPTVIRASRQVNNAMPHFIAKQTIQKMVVNDLLSKGSKVLVLGATFKENVPDTRNSKVFDLVETLESYGLTVHIVDPLANVESTVEEYGVSLQDSIEEHDYECVILAVSHQIYVYGSWPMIVKHLKPNKGVVIDIKAVLPVAEKPDFVELWRP